MAAHQRANRPAGHGHAVIRRPTGARGDPAVGDGLPPLQIDDGDIGVVTRREPALAGDAIDPRRTGAGEIDQPGERIEANVSARMLVKGKFYDLAAAGKTLAAGGTYAAVAGSQRTEFRVDPAARPGTSPIVGRLVRL